jgi:hypothetical protein
MGAPGAKKVVVRIGKSPSTAGNGLAIKLPAFAKGDGPSCAAV